MVFEGAVEDGLSAVHLPAPLSPDGIGVVAPTEDALVGTGQGRSRLHASVAFDAVESVFVAATAPSQHRLCPTAQFHAGMTTD